MLQRKGLYYEEIRHHKIWINYKSYNFKEIIKNAIRLVNNDDNNEGFKST